MFFIIYYLNLKSKNLSYLDKLFSIKNVCEESMGYGDKTEDNEKEGIVKISTSDSTIVLDISGAIMLYYLMEDNL